MGMPIDLDLYMDNPGASYGNLMLLTGDGTSGKVRCVRDVVD